MFVRILSSALHLP
jgi:hypothetical protein